MVFVDSVSESFFTDQDLALFLKIQGNDTDPADPDPQHWQIYMYSNKTYLNIISYRVGSEEEGGREGEGRGF